MKNDKSRKKYDVARAAAIKSTAKIYGVTESWVRMIAKGDRDDEQIMKTFRAEHTRISQALNLTTTAATA